MKKYNPTDVIVTIGGQEIKGFEGVKMDETKKIETSVLGKEEYYIKNRNGMYWDGKNWTHNYAKAENYSSVESIPKKIRMGDTNSITILGEEVFPISNGHNTFYIKEGSMSPYAKLMRKDKVRREAVKKVLNEKRLYSQEKIESNRKKSNQ